MTLCLGMTSHLIEDRTLHVEDAPIRVVGRMRAAERFDRLFVLARFSQRTTIGTQQRHAARVADRRLFEHSNRLRTLIGRAQGARIGDGRIHIIRIIAIARAEGVQRAPRLGLARRSGADCA